MLDMILSWGTQSVTYLNQGGFVMWPLVAGTFVLWYGIGYRFLLLRRGSLLSLDTLIERAQNDRLQAPKGIIARAALCGHTVVTQGTHDLRDRLNEALAPLEEELNSFALIVKIVVVVAPLAGLLGTVSGMIETFDALGDMTLFSQSGGIAGGISQALISTQMGLAVAIPGLLAGQNLRRKQDNLQQEIDRLKEYLCAHHAPHTIASTDDESKGDASVRMSRRKKSAEAEVDISPLIDMVFILLIFFMVSTTFVKDLKVELERPSASSATRASTKALWIHIDRGGSVYVDGASVKVWMLQSRVRSVLKSDRSRPVLVITDRLVQAEKLIEVVDQCRLAGAKDVGVATRKEAG